MKDIIELNLTYDERIELLLALNSRINELEKELKWIKFLMWVMKMQKKILIF